MANEKVQSISNFWLTCLLRQVAVASSHRHQQRRLERKVAPLMEEAEAAFETTGEKQRLFGEIEYAAGSWDRSRRVIMKVERLPEGPNRRFNVTNLTDDDPKHLYDGIYVLRGDMENRIKE